MVVTRVGGVRGEGIGCQCYTAPHIVTRVPYVMWGCEEGRTEHLKSRNGPNPPDLQPRGSECSKCSRSIRSCRAVSLLGVDSQPGANVIRLRTKNINVLDISWRSSSHDACVCGA